MADYGGYTRDAKELAIMQSYPLDMKIALTRNRIYEWVTQFGEDGVVVSFSGGKDSTVLLHLVRTYFPDVKAVFSNTGLEYPEIQRFVTSFDNVDIVRPKMRFDEVISTYGYPLISKEVAEAIYYARRIRSQDVNVERESRTSIEQYKRTELFGERTTRYSRQDGSSWGNERSTHTHGGERNSVDKSPTSQPNRLAQNRTQGGETSVKDQSGGTSNQSSRGSETFWKRTEITGQYPGERNTAGVEGQTLSQFNKEKWLPLARDVPVAISHLCCHKTKKQPLHAYQSKNGFMPFLAMLAEESRVRKQAWVRHGCNAFDIKHPTSNPLSFWTEQDILRYIVDNDIEIASVYGDIVAVDSFGNEYDPHGTLIDCKLKCTGCQRTGCIYCALALHLEKGMTRFQRLAITHPKQYEYSIGGGQWVDNPAYDPTAPKFDGEWQNWNPKKIWVPSKKGLGMGKVFDMVNEIYGKNFYRYE